MPELPDITIYVERLRALTLGQTLEQLRIISPFVLRTVEPPIATVNGRVVSDVFNIGKRIVFAFADGPKDHDGQGAAGGRDGATPSDSNALFLVLHLMIAGRFKWNVKGAGKLTLAEFRFSSGNLILTEAATRKRASIHLFQGREALSSVDRGGIDVYASADDAIAAALQRDNHTIKRALTDPTVLSGIGNAYSDEILHAAKLSPFKQTQKLTHGEMQTLITTMRRVLTEWTERFRAEVGDGFPEKVTAFRPEMAVHGRYGKPCPVCGSPVQRIRYADNEANYCATCQNAGKLFADRSLSQLLKKDWPKTLEEMEELKNRSRVR